MGDGEDTGDLAMLELFRAELDSHLPVLSEGLLALEKNSDQPKWFEAMMRAAHSIKGAARIVGVEGAVRVAHVLEDCFVAAQQRDIRFGPGAVEMSVNMSSISSASEEISVNVGTIAQAADDTAKNVEAVNSAIDGITRRFKPSPATPGRAPMLQTGRVKWPPARRRR